MYYNQKSELAFSEERSMARKFTLLGIVFVLVLAACSTGGNAGGGGSVPVEPLPEVNWDRSPNNIIFRADVIGGTGSEAFASRGEIPYCTIYGDNRIVWTNELSAYEVQVLWDQITDESIQSFVYYLVVQQQIYNYNASANLEPPSADSPVVEKITLSVNNRLHETDAFGGWPPGYFQDVLAACRTISNTPVLYEPEAAWISAQEVPYNDSMPGVVWDGAAAGLSMAELAGSGQPRWVTDNNVKVIWNLLRNSAPNIEFIEGDKQYQVAIQIPGVTRQSPDAPGS
jgi:hypothetical protein